MPKRWAVNASDAYAAWVARHRPSLPEELELVAWIAGLEDHGPPQASRDGENRVGMGPGGAEITFRVFETTDADSVAGYVFILDIA